MAWRAAAPVTAPCPSSGARTCSGTGRRLAGSRPSAGASGRASPGAPGGTRSWKSMSGGNLPVRSQQPSSVSLQDVYWGHTEAIGESFRREIGSILSTWEAAGSKCDSIPALVAWCLGVQSRAEGKATPAEGQSAGLRDPETGRTARVAGSARGVGGRTGTNAGVSSCSEPAPHLSLHPPRPHRGSPGPSARPPGDEGDSPVSRASPRGRVPPVTLPQPPFSLTSSRHPPWSPPLDPRARPSFAAVSGDEGQSQGAGSGAGRGAAVGVLAGRACGWSDGGEGLRAWSPGGGPHLRKEDSSRLGCPLHSVAAHAAARGAGLKPRVKWTRGRVGPSGGEVRSGPWEELPGGSGSRGRAERGACERWRDPVGVGPKCWAEMHHDTEVSLKILSSVSRAMGKARKG